MRIIAGRFKGRRLAEPPASGVRPTSDRLRETMFNVLSPMVAQARVLDGFAGTGAVGLEAISRGASAVTFVERDRRALAVLEQNIERCDARNACAIIRGDFTGLSARIPGLGPFDLVLLDPPYDYAQLDTVLAEAARLLANDGLIVLEHGRRRRDVPQSHASLVRVREIAAGDSALSLYRMTEPTP
jgi:16S rRNA (guanine966-N2)-methyltransferase